MTADELRREIERFAPEAREIANRSGDAVDRVVSAAMAIAWGADTLSEFEAEWLLDELDRLGKQLATGSN